MYLGNGNYQVNLSSGRTIEVNEDDFEELVLEMKKNMGILHDENVELPHHEFVWADNIRFDLMRIEVKDDGYTNVQWSDDLEHILDLTIEESYEEARKFYEHTFHMVRK
ncbi:MAG: hypothetical protein H8E16_02140 [Flavobacteriales bacterium]|nr:hypothetical protein [Flavobacteriales bacterium]